MTENSLTREGDILMNGRTREIETTQEQNTSLDYRELFAAYISREPYIFEVIELMSNFDMKNRKLILSIAQVLDVVSMSKEQEEHSLDAAGNSEFLAMPFLNPGHSTLAQDQFLP